MARATQRADTTSTRCKLYGKTDTHSTLKCADGSLRTLAREQSRPPAWVLEHARTRRGRCAAADDPPEFVSGAGAPLPPASSFGVHARISAERFLASDLHHMLCEKRGVNCSGLLRESSWQTGAFLQTLLDDPAALFTGEYNGSAGPPAAPPPADDALWDHAWVSCRRDEDTFAIAHCNGSVPRAQWLDPGSRMQACRDAMHDAGDDALARNLTLCDLDGATDELCQILAQAENTIKEANCIAAGACMSETYYYYPGTYSTTNEEFVRETVQEFYLQVDAGACDEAALEKAQLEDQVRAVIGDRRLMAAKVTSFARVGTFGPSNSAGAIQLKIEGCSALALNTVTELLEAMRTVLHAIVRIMYYWSMILLTLFRFLGVVNFEEVIQDLFYYLGQLLDEMVELVKALGEMLWAVVKESPLVKKLLEMANEVCLKVIGIVNFIKSTICKILLDFFTSLHNFLDDIEGVSIFGAKPLQGIVPTALRKGVAGAVALYTACFNAEITCSAEEPLRAAPLPTLPSATRCWAQYITSLGDASSLSCTATDTCVDGVSEDMVICDSCPATPPGINEYGCDPIRKQCACGVLQRERTPCVNHLQCTLQADATCVFVDSDVEATFGTTECAQCGYDPLCIRTAGAGVGYCSCTLTALEDEPCAPDAVGAAVAPSDLGLCLATSGLLADALGRSTAFTVEYSRLLSVPCVTVDISRTLCMRVQYSAFDTVTRIVALDVLEISGASGPFRRLMGSGGRATADLLTSPWHDAADVCGPLVQTWTAGAGALGPLEHERLEHCLRWRRVAQECIGRHNLTGVDDHFLLSLADFAREAGKFASLVSLARHPLWLADALLHSAVAQPVFAAVSLLQHWSAAYRMEWNVSHAPWAEFVFALYSRDINAEMARVADGAPPAASPPANATPPANFMETWSPVQHLLRHRALLATAPLRRRAPAPDAALPDAVRRRLTSWREDWSAVTEYSLAVTLSGDATQPLSEELAAKWVTGPARWPPDYSYWEKADSGSCVSGSLAGEIIVHTLAAVQMSYQHTGPPAATPAPSFRESAIQVRRTPPGPQTNPGADPDADVLVSLVYRLRAALRAAGLDEVLSYDLLAAIPGTLDDFFTCDLHKVMFCTHYHRTLWNSFWWVLLYCSLGLFLVQFADIPFRNVVLAAIFLPLVFFYATEYSPMCGPMVPPCLLDESIDLLDALLPTKWYWPNALQTYPGCVSGDDSMRPPAIPANASCLVPCSAAPHSFTRWEAPVAWWLCDLHRPACLQFEDWLRARNVSLAHTLQLYLAQKAEILYDGDADLVHAQRICAVLTSWYTAPWILAATVLLYVATWALLLPFIAAQNMVAISLQAYQMSHVNAHDQDHARNVFVQQAIRTQVR